MLLELFGKGITVVFSAGVGIGLLLSSSEE